MFFRHADDKEQITAGDGCRLTELANPLKERFGLDCSVALCVLDEGRRTYRHVLSACEVYYFIKGEGRLYSGGEVLEVRAGMLAEVPGGKVQYLENSGEGDLRFLCLVQPAWHEDHEEILE